MALRNTELPLDVIWPRLIAIADEMATTMFRTAFSHDVVEVHDMSTGLLDDRGYLMAQTWLGATGHTGCMPAFGANLVEAFPPETVNPGDVLICNDPWLCNGQTADIFITTPAFHKGKLIGFSVNTIHHVDIGGRKGSGLSEEVFEEGLIIPMLRLYDAGEPNEMLFDLIRRNVRYSEKMMGDLRGGDRLGRLPRAGAALRESISRPPRGLGRNHRAHGRGYPRRSPRAAGRQWREEMMISTASKSRSRSSSPSRSGDQPTPTSRDGPAGPPAGQLSDQLLARLCGGAGQMICDPVRRTTKAPTARSP